MESEYNHIRNFERFACAALGGILVGIGISNRSLKYKISAVTVGGLLIRRGLTGDSGIFKLSEKLQRKPGSVVSVQHGKGIKIEKSVSISASQEKSFRYWRNFENLPLFMGHLKSVRPLGDARSHWIAKAPGGMTVEWDAEVYRETPPHMIAWRSLGNSDINHAGSVHFVPNPENNQTQVHVELNYEPPLGKTIGGLVSAFFAEEPQKQIEDSLLRFKRLMETGEITAF